MRRLVPVIASAALIACSASAVEAKILRMAYDADPVSLDLHEQLSGGTLQLSHMVCDPLIRWGANLDFEPRLATKWERVNDTTVRFTLRSGVKHHSGNPLTMDDVVWTFNRLKTSPDFKAIFAPFKELKKVDDQTFDIVTDGPFPLVLHNATYIFPLDSKFYAGKDARGKDKAETVKHGDSFASKNISCTGPFTVASREQGVKVVFKRNPNYWDTKSPGNVTDIVFTPIKEAPTRGVTVRSGAAGGSCAEWRDDID